MGPSAKRRATDRWWQWACRSGLYPEGIWSQTSWTGHHASGGWWDSNASGAWEEHSNASGAWEQHPTTNASGVWEQHPTTNAPGSSWQRRGKRAVRTDSDTSGSWEEATPRRVKWVKRKKANPATLEWVQRKVDVSDATKRRLADFFDQAECPP